MADLTVEQLDLSTANPIDTGAVAANAGGDRFNPGSNRPVFLYVKNGGGAPITVTIDDPTSVTPPSATQFNPDVPVTVANANNKVIPIRNPERFRDANGWINITYSGVTTVTVKPFC